MRGRVKYYLKKPKRAIARDMLVWLAFAGVVAVAATSPYFVQGLLRSWAQGAQYKRKSKESAFYRMRKQGMILVEKKNHQYFVSLTKKGKQKAGWLQLDSLEIKRPHVWNKHWYFLMFDVAQEERWRRDILRSFLARLQFILFQKSIWVHPYDCRAEVEVLREFLELTSDELKIVTIPDSGLPHNDRKRLQQIFSLK